MHNNLFRILLVLGTAAQAQAKLEVHEWGTFTSLVGSNGVTQNGMYHEDEALPDFVHRFGETVTFNPPPSPVPVPHKPCKMCFDGASEVLARNVITQKMETPVLYFYSDRAQTVDVNVRFPQGVITDTFPGPVATFPTQSNNLVIANGNTTFKVLVSAEKFGKIPFVEPSNIYSHARNVDSNVVSTGREIEKFIFYRGLGRFQPDMKIQSENGSLTLSPLKFKGALPEHTFLVHVDSSGHSRMLSPSREFYSNSAIATAEDIALLKNHSSPDGLYISSGKIAREKLIRALTSSGLKLDEATAMIDTWENGYLKVPGLRLLYILPRTEVDSNLPITLTPAPEKLERVFVGRIEVLLDTEEQAILKEILTQQGTYDASKLGRFAEPILRRVYEIYSNQQEQVKNVHLLFKKLISNASSGITATTTTH